MLAPLRPNQVHIVLGAVLGPDDAHLSTCVPRLRVGTQHGRDQLADLECRDLDVRQPSASVQLGSRG
jgi:hypothetical protein